MYTLVRMYIKTALVFFLGGLFIGGWILYSRLVGSIVSPGLISAHTHLLLFGFMVTLVMGVAYWMFPRPAKEDFRYSPNLAMINYWLLTIGTTIRTVGDLFGATASQFALWAVAIGATIQIAAGILFSYNIWTRIRPVGSQHREAKGEKF